jgi:hypothetical protein
MVRGSILPREGLYIDPISVWVRKTLLNPWLMAVLSILLRYQPILSPRTVLGLTNYNGQFNFWVAGFAILGMLLNINDYLTDGLHNNWKIDESWNWDQEIVLITGGSSGIGASVAQQLSARNRNTRIVIIDFLPLSFKVPEKSNLFYYQCDLSKSFDIKATCAAIRNDVGWPTVILNNAGLTRGATVMEGSYGDVEVTFRTNIIAPFLIVKEFIPEMVRKNHGHIVATSSMSSIITPAGLGDYAATKTGLAALHEVRGSSPLLLEGPRDY